MNQGDLVKPLGSCSGEPGAKRCNIAMVLNPNCYGLGGETARIVCPCGVGEVYRTQLEVIVQVEPVLAYSADPM